MKFFNWDNEKSVKLLTERGVSFEDVVFYIQQGGLLNKVEHPNQKKYPGQHIFVVDIDDYVYLVPFVENNREVFLKTIIPSRKATKEYLGR